MVLHEFFFLLRHKARNKQCKTKFNISMNPSEQLQIPL